VTDLENKHIKVGLGYDIHRLEFGRQLLLGGVEIIYEKGLLGHSDADVLVHAIIDSLLGAIGERDIGFFFPDTDVTYKNANSMDLLKTIWHKVAGLGYEFGNLDTIIIAESPKLSPYIEQIKSNISKTLQIEASKFAIKAKTNEGLGPEGEGKAISAQAIVCLYFCPS